MDLVLDKSCEEPYNFFLLEKEVVCMIFDLTPLIKREEDSLDFEFSFEEPAFDYYGDRITFEAPVNVSGSAKRINEQLFLEIEISTRMSTQCARCLKPVHKEQRLSYFEELMPADRENEIAVEENVLFYDNRKVDLKAYVMEQLMVNVPIKVLCSEHCAGICNICGHDRNEENCSCEQDLKQEKETDPRLAQLKDWIEKVNK
jgi:uncharacterized protein